MYATSSTGSAGPRRPRNSLYQQVDTQSRALSASPHRLVALLFDGLIEAINRARGAMQRHDIPAKGEAISRAIRIVSEGLQAGLVRNANNELADNMHALYGYINMRLTHANLHNDDAALQECQRLIAPLRDAWAEIGAQVESRQP